MEAEHIEVWALEHTAKAAGTVIEYETDWNIEIERDDAEDDTGAEKGTDGCGRQQVHHVAADADAEWLFWLLIFDRPLLTPSIGSIFPITVPTPFVL